MFPSTPCVSAPELMLPVKQLIAGSWLPSKQESESRKACSRQKSQPFRNLILEVTPITLTIFCLLDLKEREYTEAQTREDGYHLPQTPSYHTHLPFCLPFLSPIFPPSLPPSSNYRESPMAQELCQALGIQSLRILGSQPRGGERANKTVSLLPS